MDCSYYPIPAVQPPGDPYQYDLRWIVSQIQSLKAFTGDLAKSVGAQGGNIEGLNLAQKQLCEEAPCRAVSRRHPLPACRSDARVCPSWGRAAELACPTSCVPD